MINKNLNDENSTEESNDEKFVTRLFQKLQNYPILFALLSLIGVINYKAEKYGEPVTKLQKEKEEALKKGDMDRANDIADTLRNEFKLTTSEQVTIFILYAMGVFKDNRTEIGYLNGKFHLYNGAYWESVDSKIMEEALCSMSIKSGMKYYTVRQPKNKKLLIDTLASEATIPQVQHDLIKINLRNGTYVINPNERELGKLQNHNPDDGFMYQLGFKYDPEAEAPEFSTFLERVLPDENLRRILMEFIAYSLTDLNYEKTLFAYGSGGNGKSTVINIIYGLLGRENVSSYSAPKLTDNSGYYRSQICEKLLNCCTEFGSGNVDFELLKKMISNEIVDARNPYKEAFEFQVKTRLIFSMNRLPYTDAVEAMRRRILLIPFEQTIPSSEQKRDLAKEICKTELPGVFNLVLEALKRLIEQGCFTESKIAEEAVDSYMQDNNNVAIFMNECFYVKTEKRETSRDELYQAYKRFCNENGYSTCASNKFGNRLRELGYEVERGAKGYYYVNCKVELPGSKDETPPLVAISVIDQIMGNLSQN